MELIRSADLVFPMLGLMQLDFLGEVLDGKDEPDLISSEWLLDRIPVDSALFIFMLQLMRIRFSLNPSFDKKTVYCEEEET